MKRSCPGINALHIVAILSTGSTLLSQQIPLDVKEPPFMAYAFNSNTKALKAFLAKGECREFLTSYNEHAKELSRKAPKLDWWYYQASKAFNDNFRKEVEPSFRAITETTATFDFPASRWQQAIEAYRDLDLKMKDYRSFQLLKDSRFMAPEAGDWDKALAAAKAYFLDHLDAGFKEWLAANSAGNFFSAYPMTQGEDPVAFLNAHQAQLLEHARNAGNLATDPIFAWIRPIVSAPSLTSYIEEATHMGGPTQSWLDFIQQIQALRALGVMEPVIQEIFDRHVAVFTVASRNSQESWNNLVFPDLKVQQILPGLAERTIRNREGGKAFLVLLAGASASTDRQIASKQDQASRYLSGQHFEPNPDYDTAVINVDIARQNMSQAQAEYNRQMAQSQNSGATGLGALGNGLNSFAVGVMLGQARSRLQEAYTTLQSTPRQVKVLDYEDYSYTTTELQAVKNITYTAYFLSLGPEEVLKSAKSHRHQRDFSLAYNLNKQDPSFNSLHARYQEESDVEAFERDPLPLTIAALIAEDKDFERINTARLLAEVQSAKPASAPSHQTAAMARVAATAKDLRFDSVVIIQNPRGGMGAGFYVAPNLVVTNQHVVAGSAFPEVKLRTGETCVGKVIKSDLGLDLALIKVPKAGKPLELVEDNFEVGTSVDAIGHPKGLSFTLTRGIISAVRYIENPLVPGSRKMLVIQMDAAINPGNSGGPLLIGDKVIGVNSQKLSAKGVEGLGFALHASEVRQFIGGSPNSP